MAIPHANTMDDSIHTQIRSALQLEQSRKYAAKTASLEREHAMPYTTPMAVMP